MMTAMQRVIGRFLLPLAVLGFLAACDSAEDRVQKYYERGNELVEAGTPRKATLEYRNALQIDEGHVPSHLALAQVYESISNLRQSFVHYYKVAELEPDHVEALIKLAQFYVLGGEPDKADDMLNRALAIAPDDVKVQTVRATIAMSKNDFEAAREAIDLALAFAPNDPDAALVEVSLIRQTDSIAAALTRLDAAIAANPDAINLHVSKLRMLNEAKDADGLARQLDVMIGFFPENPDYLRARSSLANQRGDHEAAEADLRRVVELTQKSGNDDLVLLIRLLRTQKGDDAARAELERRIAAADEPIELQLMLSQFEIEIGQRDKAISLLESISEGSGDDANRARVALARLYYQDGQTDKGDALVATILEQDPKNVDAAVFRVMREIDDQKLVDAVQTARTALNEAPNDVRLLRLAGRAQELSGNLNLANDRLASAVRADGFQFESVDQYVQFLMRSNRITAAETIMSEAISRSPRETRLYNLLGYMRLRVGNWLGAEEAAQALEAIDPDRARELRASILVGQERFEEGAALLDGLPETDQRRAFSIASRVQGLIREGKFQEAFDMLNGILETDPENVQALGLSGNLLMSVEDYEGALKRYNRILEIDPANSGAHSALARLYSLRGDLDASRKQILEGLRISPDDLILLARLANIHESEGRFGDAIDVYRKLYEIIPDSLLIANNLASLLSDHRADDPVSVEQAYTIASRLRPSDIPQYRDTYGWTRYLNGEYREALERIQPVAAALPQNPWVHYHLGMIYAAMKRPGDARTSLETAVQLVGNLPFPPLEQIRSTLAGMQTQ